MIKILLGLIPELLKLLWVIYQRYKEGADSTRLKREMEALRELLKDEDRALAARKLSSAWASHDHNKL